MFQDTLNHMTETLSLISFKHITKTIYAYHASVVEE